MMIFHDAEKLKALREAKGLSQHQLTIRAGLSWGSICRMERHSTKKINLLRAKEIARILGCGVWEFCERPAGKKVG